MVRFTSLATLALVPLAQARFDWLYARDTIAQCPPCTMEGEQQECSHTVTVTKPAGSYETVTVSDPKGSYHTVTVTEHGEPGKTVTVTQNYQKPETKVVYISQGETLDPPKQTVTITAPGKVVTVTETETNQRIVTKQVNVYPGPGNSNGNGYQPGPKTVTISNGYPAPSAGSPGYNGGDSDNVKYPDAAHTVTVIDDGKVKTLTYTDGGYNTVVKTVTQDNGKEKVVTVTGGDNYEVVKTMTLGDGKKIVKTVTAENTNNYVVTKTVHEGDKDYTVIVKPEPTVSTIAKDNGEYDTTIVEAPHTYTLTAPVRYGSASPTDEDCETFTRTATYTGQPEVEVIVYDPETGDSTCTKEDGQPCRPGYDNDKTGYDNKGPDNSEYPGSGDDGKDYQNDDSKGQYPTKDQDGNNGYNSNVPVYTKVLTYGNGDTYTEVYGADPTGCDSFAVSTSIATVYNTVVVTVEPSSTAVAKKARSPLSVRW
ncbi:uncharacterized protein B0J16DRAFT_110838 [Fusarium flagelliforme]|uniref:Uncharacterized protein n=1 Tax=Fusarium flagelliforme TaxID=2675880 RepID=A0A395MQ63_9HYPO|nr:uncharacterized protein B0J16DRAFT_110838 [Fusarium flagelliforme]KAH7189219.1 hypothetical protein B0J16DRAFT_110838 [Fusarium flagelliforme]RFN49239.1 hypothetical protein FIE12Z_6460 [Fusarium flagelliforme]